MKISDPVLCFYAFFDKHMPISGAFDPRILFLDTLKASCDRLNLDFSIPAQYSDPDKIDLVELSRSPPNFNILINRYHKEEAGTNQVIGYVFTDTLILQISVSKNGLHELEYVFSDLEDKLLPLIEATKSEREGIWGHTFLFWGLVKNEDLSMLDRTVIAKWVGEKEESTVKEAKTKIGEMFEVNTKRIDNLKVLFTSSSTEMEQKANQVLFYKSGFSPADFPVMEMSHHKFFWEYHEYNLVKEELERIRKSVDRRANWLIDTQRAYGDKINVANSREANEFILKLSRAMTNYSDFTQSITRVRELRNTLRVNQATFELRIEAFLDKGGLDSIFSPRVRKMGILCKQLDIDSDYYSQVLKRSATVLDAAQARLNILRGREETEAAKLRGIQTSALATVTVIAFMFQLTLNLPEFKSNLLLSTSFMLAVAAGTFSLFQIILNWNRVHTTVERITSSATLGFAFSTIVIWLLKPAATITSLIYMSFAFITCIIFGYSLFKYVEESVNRKRDKSLEAKAYEVTGIRKLNYAIEELPDLLEDLPVTRLWRIKDEKSLLEKLVRKGPAYTIRDITDAIGIRYVVSPWELPRIVERVISLVKVEKIEYRNDKIGSKTDVEGTKVFQPGYKSVHIDADLWGVGDKRDINLIAEIQVRTRIQDIYANFCHDKLYKPRSGKRPTGLKGFFVKAAVYLLQWISDIELFIFGGWMGWQTKTETKKKS